jgi:hypothetical protein
MTDNNNGDNVAQNEKLLGVEGSKLIRRYESQLKKHDKIIDEIHVTIIEFGRVLQGGLDMYGPGREFGEWVKRRHLDTGIIGGHQTERTACMIIMRLSDHGIEPDEGDDTVPCRLDLTECQRTRPTDILKWARQKQRHLFPHLRPRGSEVVHKPKAERTAKEIAATITGTPGINASTVKAVVRELQDWVKATASNP